jgi:ribosomal protein S18 acetylase RimI-like enzyme
MPIEVRALRPEEYDEAGRVTALAYREFAPRGNQDWEEYLDRIADVSRRAAGALVLGAFRDGRVLGTVTVELEGRIEGGHDRDPLDPDEAHIRMLGVDPEARGAGIGRVLMDAAVVRARRAGKRRMTLGTTERMAAAHRLYESMGFVRGPDQVFDDGFRLRTYELSL